MSKQIGEKKHDEYFSFNKFLAFVGSFYRNFNSQCGLVEVIRHFEFELKIYQVGRYRSVI